MCFDPDIICDNEVILIYSEDQNLFVTDDFGNIVYNIFDYITPNALYLFLSKKDDMFIYGVDGQPVVLIYGP